MPDVLPDASLGFHLLDRLFLACYAVAWYIVRLLAPIDLVVIHPFPIKNGPFLPLKYYASPVLLLFIGLLLLWQWRTQRAHKEIVFGGLFFLGTIFVALHLFPIGGVSVVAERYTYLASIGLFFLVAHGVLWVFKNPELSSMKPFVIVFLILYIGFWAVTTYQRTGVWQNSVTLWTDQISKHPQVEIAYNNRGYAQEHSGNYAAAILDYTAAIELNPNYSKAYANRGNARDKSGDYEGAFEDFTRAIELDPADGNIYNNRGVVQGIIGQYQGALDDFNQAIALEPDDVAAYANRGNAYAKLGNPQQAFEDFHHALALNPKHMSAYFNRAILYIQQSACQQASEDIRQYQSLGGQLSAEFFAFFNQHCQ
jgi:tetratricopeptide (TPR) repeat protein